MTNRSVPSDPCRTQTPACGHRSPEGPRHVGHAALRDGYGFRVTTATPDNPAGGEVRGECPSVHAPFAEVDGALLRVRVPGGVLSSAAARGIAEVVAQVGGGAIE